MKRLLRRIGLQSRVEDAQVVPMRGVSLLEESYVVHLGSEQAATITQPGAWTLELPAVRRAADKRCLDELQRG